MEVLSEIKKLFPSDTKMLVWLLAPMAIAYFDVKTDMVLARQQREFLQYQVNELKSNKSLSAIKPEDVRLEEEKKHDL